MARSPGGRWGTYVSERQWGTVREDYIATGDAWNYFPHDNARNRAYRWGDGHQAAGLCTPAIPAKGHAIIRLRLSPGDINRDAFADFDQIMLAAVAEIGVEPARTASGQRRHWVGSF